LQNLNPTILDLSAKKMIGLSLTMSFAQDQTPILWKSFMPNRNKVQNRKNEDYYSLQIFPNDYFKFFNPITPFVKWALVEVSDFENIPEGMESFTLEPGKYAVFHHKGVDKSIFQYIYGVWLPASGYQMDNRPHFEILGAKYKNGDPNSEEDIYIPIK